MSGMWLPGSALIIAVFLCIIYLIKEKQDNKEVKIYGYLLITNFIFSLNALLVYIYAKTVGDVSIIGLMQKLHLALLLFVGYFLLSYNIHISKMEEKYKNILDIVTRVITIILSLTIFILPVEVINEGEILDVGGYSYYASMFGICLYLIIVIILSIKFFIDNRTDNKKTIPIFILLLMFAIGLLLRAHYPEIITETYCTTFVLLVMYFTIENPDIRLLEQVSLAKEKAEKANAAKTDFLSSMSHEIRTPLNAIVGFSSYIEEASSLEEAKENAKDILKASNNLLEIVNGILDISKLEGNKMEIVNDDYDLRQETDAIIKLIKPRIGEKNIELTCEIAKDIPTILYGDKSKYKEILTNLLTNAVKFTKEGFIKVNISCINKGTDSNLVISVEDTGRGIKEENIDKLFNKFERMEEDRNTTTEGAGLGLAITKQIVEMMGGKIIVHSKFGEGSQFTVYLKQKISTTKEESVTLPKELKIEGKKVLIVDDNELNLKVAQRVLSKYNLNITTCKSGYECIDLIKQDNNFDLILLDDMMPKMSGIETLHILQEIPSFKTRVVALTANAIDGMRDKYISEGFDEYLAKPIEKEQLEKILRRFLNNEIELTKFEPLPEEMYEISNEDVEKINKEK